MNPFTLVYLKLYDMLSQHDLLKEHVQAMNFVKLDQQALPKKSVSTADLPEILLTQTSMEVQLNATSSAAYITTTYNVITTVGSWDIAYKTADIQWALLGCSSEWCSELTKLKWNDERFINSAEVGDVALTLLDTEQNRGIMGWSLNWPLLIRMSILSKELRNL